MPLVGYMVSRPTLKSGVLGSIRVTLICSSHPLHDSWMTSRWRKLQKKADNGTTANLGFESELWKAADAMRGNLESAEYKHVVLGLLFLKYVSDAFQERHAQLLEERKTDPGLDPEDPDEYTQKNIFYIPPHARWPHLKDNAKGPEIGKIVDDAMKAVEDADRTGQLRGVLPREYGRPALDKARLGQVIDLLSNIGVAVRSTAPGHAGPCLRYFIGMFASAPRVGGAGILRPPVVRLLVEMLQPRPNTDLRPVPGRAACSCSPRSSSRPTARARSRSRCTARK